MGKKLRNRQIINEEELQSGNTETAYPIAASLSKNRLKKLICKKLCQKVESHSEKHTNFSRHLNSASFSSILDQTKFECPICLQLMVQPTLMSCGHMYCYRCLESNLVQSTSCGLCRQPQNPQNYIASVFADILITQVLAPRSNQILKYLCRTTDACEWVKKRVLSNVRPGLIVDFQDVFKAWRRGIILKTSANKEGNLMVSLKYFFKGTEILETIGAYSKRLAPLNFFTRSKYLQEFAPALPEYDPAVKDLPAFQCSRFESASELFPVDGNQEECLVEFGQLERQQGNQSLEDQALALFNWEMNGSDLLF